MTEATLKDLITMLDFFDPELPVYVDNGGGDPLLRVKKVKLEEAVGRVVIYTEVVP